MKRLIVVLLVLIASVQSTEIASAARRGGGRRVVVRRPVRRREVVVVHRGWPLRRPLRAVYIHPARVAVRVTTAAFLAPVVWTAAVIATPPAHEMLVWEDSEVLAKEDDWSEFTLDCNARGTQLYLEVVDGKAQFDWAEVVFENGDARVVDFSEKTKEPGLYSLLDFKDGRRVDHVRMVARAKSDESKVALKMEK